MSPWPEHWTSRRAQLLWSGIGALLAVLLATRVVFQDWVWVELQDPNGNTRRHWLPRAQADVLRFGINPEKLEASTRLPRAIAPTDPAALVLDATSNGWFIAGTALSQSALLTVLGEHQSRTTNSRVIVRVHPGQGYPDLTRLMQIMAAAKVKDVELVRPHD